jgi:RNA polymerase sigma-70 factor, ECF subfamily
MSAPGNDVTVLLAQVRAGNQQAAEQLIPLIYNELRRIAGAYLRRERPGQTLQATALVHEAYLRLANGQEGPWQNRAHFFAIAANTMRRILVDHARRRLASKRGGGARKVELDDSVLIGKDKLEDVIAVDEALKRLEKLDPRLSQLVELRYFTGLDVEDAAEAMGISTMKLKREWRSAKAWLNQELTLARP